MNQVLWSYFGFSLELHLSQRGKEEEAGLMEEGEDGDAGDQEEPDPEHKVDLLVNDVDGEGAHPRVVYRIATWAYVDHGALHNLGEDLSEGLVDEHQVHGVHLGHSQDQTGYLAEQQLESTGIKPPTVGEEEVSKTSNLLSDWCLSERVC